MRGVSVTILFLVGLGLAHGQSNSEIESASLEIWNADANRFADADCQYDPYGTQLFTYVNEAAFAGTYTLFLNLRDNYNPDVTVAEPPCEQCDTEIDNFLNKIVTTDPMLLAETYLRDWGHLTGSMYDLLWDLWFQPYTRGGGPLGSSGFEHVFIGEIKNNGVSGFHNWVQTYFEEQAGNFVYGSSQAVCQPDLPKFSMDWLGYYKSVDSIWMRTSPEVELALYTLCYMSRPDSLCTVDLAGDSVQIQTWTISCASPELCVGSAYPAC